MRHLPLERDFLQGAARDAGLGALGFERLVSDRLAEGQALYGFTALARPLGELVRELREEGLDLGAWAVLAAQSDEVDELDDDQRLLFLSLLQAVAGKGAEVENLLRQAAEVISK